VNLITNTILNIRGEYINSNYASSYRSINNGLCSAFAEEIVSLINDDNVINISMDWFFEDEEFNSNELDKWDQKVLKEWGIPYNEKLDNIIFGYHVWVTDGERHYDSECPEGVENFLELPFFRRYLN
jgi:hypothetical protein